MNAQHQHDMETYLLHQHQQERQPAAIVGESRHDWRETLPERFPSVAQFARRPLVEQIALITLAAMTGGYLFGIFAPVLKEIIAGKIGGLPFPFWGLTLWLLCAAFFKRRNWLAFGWFSFVFFLMVSWI